MCAPTTSCTDSRWEVRPHGEKEQGKAGGAVAPREQARDRAHERQHRSPCDLGAHRLGLHPVPRRRAFPRGDDAVRAVRLREQEDLQPLTSGARAQERQHGRELVGAHPLQAHRELVPAERLQDGRIGLATEQDEGGVAASGLGGELERERARQISAVGSPARRMGVPGKCTGTRAAAWSTSRGSSDSRARPRASRGCACARAEFASCAAGSRHTTAAHPCRQRCSSGASW